MKAYNGDSEDDPNGVGVGGMGGQQNLAYQQQMDSHGQQ